jgi:signal transduction histidine kinase
MRWRIRSQLLVPLLLLLLGVVGGSLWMGLDSRQRVRRQIETRVQKVAQTLSEKSTYPLTENVLALMKGLSEADYLLVPPTGSWRTTLDRVPAERPPADTVTDDWHTLRLGRPVTIAGQTFLCGGIRLRPPRNDGTLYVLYPEALWHDALWEATWPVLLLGGGVGAASVLLALGLGQSLSRRIRELERRTRLIAAGDFSPMPLPRRNDEIRDLTRSVNDMAQKLAQYQETVQRAERLRLLDQVSGGLAHQLRNGLTGARLAVQLYLQENAGATDAAALEVALRQLTLLEANLKRFLDLGRDGCRRRDPCALPALVGEAVELLRPRCWHTGIELRWQPPEDSEVRGPRSEVQTLTSDLGLRTPDFSLEGDPGQLGQVILNVLGNAIEAAGPGGSVTIRMGKEGDTLWLEVWDSGPGPAAEVEHRLFEPFVTGKPEGVGLGLAVARQIVEAHGGRISWRRQDAGTCFRIELPAGAAQQHDTGLKGN